MPSGFIGRKREVEEVMHLCRTQRLVTLTGVGGSGKSRLALRVAAELAERFPDGVWLVELDALSSAEHLVKAVMKVMGVAEEADRPLLESLIEYIGPKQLLLVLDNCEHLLSACAALTASLLGASPLSQVLTTSREPLRVADEMVWSIPPLSLPDREPPTGSVEALLTYDAIRLFVERAQAARSDFRLTAENGPAVLAVCQQLDGIPLALELAASRIRVLAVQEVAQRLYERFRILSTTDHAIARHQTMRAALDWSYEMLSEPEQILWRQLSVFAGRFTIEPLEEVCAHSACGAWDVMDLLERLIRRSIVIAAEQGGKMTYRLLETVRHYGAERLRTAGEEVEFRNRHLKAYLRLVAPPSSAAEQRGWLDRLELEYDNLRLALAWAAESGQHGLGLRLASSIGEFWMIRGYLAEGRAWLEAFLQERVEDDQVWVKGLRATSWIAKCQGHYTRARELLDCCVELIRIDGDMRLLSGVLNDLGVLATLQGDYKTARAYYEESLSLKEALGHPPCAVVTLCNLGRMADDQGDFQTAHTRLCEALEIFRRLGDETNIANSLLHLGLVARHQNDDVTALSLYSQSLAIYCVLSNKVGIAHATRNLGDLALVQGDARRAIALLEESLTLFREIGDAMSIVTILTCLAEAQLRAAEAKRAVESAREAICLLWQGQRHGLPTEWIVINLITLAEIAIQSGAVARAARLLGAVEMLRSAFAKMSYFNRSACERRVGKGRELLGQTVPRAIWQEGRRMTMDQAIAYALDDRALEYDRLSSDARVKKSLSDTAPGGLTRREVEVVRLVSEGMNNAETAHRLTISHRTVENHMRNILHKLGLPSRTSLVVWAIRTGVACAPLREQGR